MILLRSGEALASPLTRLYFPLVGVSLVRTSLVFVGPAFASLLLATAPQFSLGSPRFYMQSWNSGSSLRLSCSAFP